MASPLGRIVAKHPTASVFIAMFLLAYVVFGGIATVSWWRYARVAYTGAHTQGRITAKEPANHHNVRYSFMIGPQQFTGAHMASIVGIPFDSVAVGDAIPVVYDPRDPTKSVAGDPSALLRWCYTGLFVWLPLFCTLPAAVAAYRVHHPNFLSMRRAAI
jgi:Na+/proline symporter